MKKQSIIKLNKSQAAMEFLMTYGWALLVVLIAIAALAFFGLLNPSRFLPERVDLMPGLHVAAATLDKGLLTIIVNNGMGETLHDLQFKVEDCIAPSPKFRVVAGQTQKFEMACANTNTRSRLNSRIDIRYRTRTAGHTLSHARTGRVVLAEMENPIAHCVNMDTQTNINGDEGENSTIPNLVYNINGCDHYYIVDGCGTGTVLDTIGGLCFQRNMSSSEDADDCNNLSLAGRQWVMPTLDEFKRILDINEIAPMVIGGNDNIFQNVDLVLLYGTSSTGSPDTAWVVFLEGGDVMSFDIDLHNLVVCVSRNVW